MSCFYQTVNLNCELMSVIRWLRARRLWCPGKVVTCVCKFFNCRGTGLSAIAFEKRVMSTNGRRAEFVICKLWFTDCQTDDFLEQRLNVDVAIGSRFTKSSLNCDFGKCDHVQITASHKLDLAIVIRMQSDLTKPIDKSHKIWVNLTKSWIGNWI